VKDGAHLWVSSDPRALGVSLSARGVLLDLVTVGGSVEMLPGQGAEATLVALVRGVAGAPEAAHEIVAAELVRVHHLASGRKVLALSPPARLEVEVLPAEEPRPAPAVVAPPEARSKPPVATLAAWQGKPSSNPVATRLRNDKSLFQRRHEVFRSVPEGLSWEDWCDTDEGIRHVDGRERSYPGYEALAYGLDTPAPTPARHLILLAPSIPSKP
jgi:hypothetical protein